MSAASAPAAIPENVGQTGHCVPDNLQCESSCHQKSRLWMSFMADSKQQIKERKIAAAGTGALAKYGHTVIRGCGDGRIHCVWWSTFFGREFYNWICGKLNQEDILSNNLVQGFF